MSKTAAEKQADAEAKAAADALEGVEPLADRMDEAQAKGYQGHDASDLAGQDGDGVNGVKAASTDSPQYGGVQLEGTDAKTPGGHPADPTVASTVGSAGK